MSISFSHLRATRKSISNTVDLHGCRIKCGMTFVGVYTTSLCNLNLYFTERHGFSTLVILGLDPGLLLSMNVTMDAASSVA
ncbi:hypothetical protein CR164_02305 [Prosthecochloris marina]|uniref:Uncharacterized protein n=1 Tax=Prosthecochloris marina TaxID=2017681 RepID=A0A317T9Y6_9CHLB|nr:hypothetical protein [Prosthecochloris marina]PWW82607.1 hypothetical protein CR164_02305 [Prosthecochloris marina]